MLRISGVLAVVGLVSFVNIGAVACDRDCLIEAGKVLAMGGDVGAARVTENGIDVAAAQAWGHRATGIDVHNAYADQDNGQVMVVGTGTGADGEAAVFGLRALISDGAAQEVEWMVTHKGEASLFPRQLPIAHDSTFDSIVPEDQRATPERMIELANIYFDGIEISNGDALPVSEGCNRVENGIQMTHSKRFPDMHCNTLGLFTYIPVVEQRRFPIIDEDRGIVAAIVMFQIPEADIVRIRDGKEVVRHYDPRSLYLFEAFKVIGDEVHQIEATMRNLEYGQEIPWPAK